MTDWEMLSPVVSSATQRKPLDSPSASKEAGSAAAGTWPEAMASKRTGIFCSSAFTTWSAGTPAWAMSLSMTYSRMVLEPTPISRPARSASEAMPSPAVMMPKRPWLASAPRQIQQMRTSVPEAKRLAVTMGSVMATSTSPLDTAAMSSVADWNLWMSQVMPAFSNRPSDSATHMGRMSSVGRVPRLILAGAAFGSVALSASLPVVS